MKKKKVAKRKKPLGEVPKPKDKPTTFGLIGSALVPIAGGIAYLKQKDDYPKSANAYGIVALASFGLAVVYQLFKPKQVVVENELPDLGDWALNK
jgi:hypothetical protein